jgi:hypothetical protein
MKVRKSFVATLLLFAGLCFGVTLTHAQAKHDRFDDHDRQVARGWYKDHHNAFKREEGKNWHEDWEPNIREGFVLTPDMRVAIQPAPADLIAQFGPAPDGYRYVVIGDHVALIDRDYRIHDVLHFELNF